MSPLEAAVVRLRARLATVVSYLREKKHPEALAELEDAAKEFEDATREAA